MNGVLIIFVCVIVALMLTTLIALLISTYPPFFLVKRLYRNPLYSMEEFYFYYNKATAYRMLFTGFSVFANTVQVLSIASTFITLYIAVSDTKYVILASLISATFEVGRLMLQPEKYIKAFSDAALIMEFALLEILPADELKENLLLAYKQAEDRISETK